MNIADIFWQARNDSINDLVPLTKIKTAADKELFNKQDYAVGFTLDEFILEFPAVDSTKIFFNNKLNKTYYYDRDNHILFPITLVGKKFLSPNNTPMGDMIKKTSESFAIYHQSGNYYPQMIALNDRMRMEYFNMLIEDNVQGDLYKNFIEAYALSDYGCDAIPCENIRKLMRSRSLEEAAKAKRIVAAALKHYPDEVIIFRGESSKSTPYDRSWSWTTDINVANFFATRFGNEGSRIITGKAAKDNIEHYFDDEKECFVDPSNIEVVETLELYGYSWLETETTPYIINLYHQHKAIIIDEYKSAAANNLHTPLHSMRVLYLSLILGSIFKLNHKELSTLAISAAYHDLGRVDDSIDDSHGHRSAKIFLKRNKKHTIDAETAAFLIAYHCLDDSMAFRQISKRFSGNKKTSLLYNIIKDADALDRVRFGKDGLDISYLRLDESKKMTLIALRLLDQITM